MTLSSSSLCSYSITHISHLIQLDARALKTVAIENSKDADAAVEVVLSEILPYVSEQEKPQSAPFQYLGSFNLSDGEGDS